MDNETNEVNDGVESSTTVRTSETSDIGGPGDSEGHIREENAKSETPKGLPSDQEWNEVDLNEAQQRRFNRMYAQVKQGERVMKQLADDNKKLLAKLQDLDSRTTEKEIRDSEVNLKAARRAALENGNYEEAEKYEDELDKLKEARYEAKLKAKEEQIQEPEEEQSVPGLSTQDKQKLDAWAYELNASGEPLRPYVDETHDDYAVFKGLADAVLTDKRMNGKSIEEYFNKVDKLCIEAGILDKPTQKRQNPSVLSNLAGEAKQKKQLSLTPEQRKVARMMKLTDEEYYESLNE